MKKCFNSKWNGFSDQESTLAWSGWAAFFLKLGGRAKPSELAKPGCRIVTCEFDDNVDGTVSTLTWFEHFSHNPPVILVASLLLVASCS